MLSQTEIDAFDKNGCIVCPDAVTTEQLAALRRDLDAWIEESRRHSDAYGEMVDGRPRFDLEHGHGPNTPALRRVSSPTEISDAFLDAVTNSRTLDILEDLMGPDIRFHHSKINSKLPHTKTVVDWHQDFAYDPHSNDDVLTCLLFLDDVTLENGPLMTAPGSHKGPIMTLWHDGRFTGAVDEKSAQAFEASAVTHTGPAGSVCIMHGRAAHASRANDSDHARRLFIFVVAAADAIPLSPNPVPSRHAGMLLRGVEPNRIRSQSFEMDIPEYPKGASFFVQQQGS